MVQETANHILSESRISIHTRKASLEDLPELPSIFNHYITNSVISFRLDPINVDLFEDVLTTTQAQGLPFLVSTIPAAPYPISEGGGTTIKEKVIGYAYAMPWRSNYAAYRHTVEISIYISPDYVSVGAGSALMNDLMAGLRRSIVHDPTTPITIANDGDLERLNTDTGRIREVLSIMALDIGGRDKGYGLETFYTRWGFERTGLMKRVGFKFGRWIDVLIMQASL